MFLRKILLSVEETCEDGPFFMSAWKIGGIPAVTLRWEGKAMETAEKPPRGLDGIEPEAVLVYFYCVRQANTNCASRTMTLVT